MPIRVRRCSEKQRVELIMNAQIAEKRKALRTHHERKHKASEDYYGATADTSGNVATVALPVVTRDGRVSAERLDALAKLTSRGVVVSVTDGAVQTSGYAVVVHDREQQIGGFVYGDDLMDYIRDNWDVLNPNNNGDSEAMPALLSLRRDPVTRRALLNVCMVVHNMNLAKRLAGKAKRREYVDMVSGRVCRA